MGFLPFGKGNTQGKDSIDDSSSSLTSLSTANVESSIPRTTIEADGVGEKKVAEATSMASGINIEGKDVIDDSISKGRVMLEQLKAKYNNASSAPSSLKSLNVPSMKSREADVLILEEKVSRMTNELNVAIREKGVAKMQLEEINAESLLLQINLNKSEAKKEEMTLRHERAAKAILTLQKRAEEAEAVAEAGIEASWVATRASSHGGGAVERTPRPAKHGFARAHSGEAKGEAGEACAAERGGRRTLGVLRSADGERRLGRNRRHREPTICSTVCRVDPFGFQLNRFLFACE